MSQMLKYYLGQNPLSNIDIINLKKSKKKFTDELFSPNEKSLLSANKEVYNRNPENKNNKHTISK